MGHDLFRKAKWEFYAKLALENLLGQKQTSIHGKCIFQYNKSPSLSFRTYVKSSEKLTSLTL